MKALFAVAPNFHCSGSWKDRLLVAEGSGWRAPHDDELADLTLTKRAGGDTACSCLFSVPAHMRTRFWAMLNELSGLTISLSLRIRSHAAAIVPICPVSLMAALVACSRSVKCPFLS